MNKLRGAILLSAFALVTLPLMPVQFLLRQMWPRGARQLPHHYHRLVAKILGIHITIEGVMPKDGPALIVSNHVSWIDIVALSAVLPVSFIAKREVGGWPFFGQLAKLQGSIFVDRDRRQKTAAAQDEIGARLNAGDMLVLFPEGTSHDGVSVLPFRSAFFGVAERIRVPVFPVTLAYARVNGLKMTRRQRPLFAWYGDMELPPHLWRAVTAGPIGVTVRFHPAGFVAEAGGRKALSEQSERAIRRSLAFLLHGRDDLG